VGKLPYKGYRKYNIHFGDVMQIVLFVLGWVGGWVQPIWFERHHPLNVKGVGGSFSPLLVSGGA
jgi:hypothetical protein